MTQQRALSRESKRQVAAWGRAQGLTQQAAAEQAGVRREQVSKWERTGDAIYWAAWDEARAELKRHAWAEAWTTLRAKLRSSDEAIQIAAARIIVGSSDAELPKNVTLTALGVIETVTLRLPEEREEL